jgi:hypothetical protein
VHSRTKLLALVSGIAGMILTAVSIAAAVAVQPASTLEVSTHPDAADIARALDIVKADPNLAAERTITTLRWKDQQKDVSRSAWVAWVLGLFGWLARSARLMVWGLLIALSGVLIVYIIRTVQKRRVPSPETAFVAPTHVWDLDIRSETLPADIGGAARALWDRGEHRAALALLYRGVLSRLAHVHRLPIRDSTTEGDCLALATRHLAPAGRDYASRVISVWQRAVYGHDQVQASLVHPLCDDFAAALGTRSPAETGGAEGAL